MGKGFYTKETLKEWKKYEKATDKCMKPRENFSQKFGEIVMKMGIRAEKVFIKEVKTFLDNEGNCIQKEATKLRKKLKARRKEIEAALLKSAKGTRNKATK